MGTVMRNPVFDDCGEAWDVTHRQRTSTATRLTPPQPRFTITIKPATVFAALAALDVAADELAPGARYRTMFVAAADAIRSAVRHVDVS
jgi:hypothetical protein